MIISDNYVFKSKLPNIHQTELAITLGKVR